ncbi:hypothetical protein OSTOST_14584 [Ostertagia ostertagi]
MKTMKTIEGVSRTRSIEVTESRTQKTEKRARPPSRRSSRMRREDSSRMKSVKTQHDDGTIKTVNIKQLSRVLAVEPVLTMQSVKLKEIKGIEELKAVGTQEDEIITLTRLDDDPTIIQQPPNRYEKAASDKQMVVDPERVEKRGNIDNMYTKLKTQFIDQLREIELPSDREMPEKQQDASRSRRKAKCATVWS